MRMIHRWSGLMLQHHLTLSTLVFHLTAFLLLTQRGGQCEMIGSPEPIVAMIGEDVILPCHLDRCTNVVSMTLEWTRLDLSPRFVHVRRDGEEFPFNQNPAFVGRVSSSAEKMQHGDLSLKLSKVRVSDEGTYRCQMPGMGSSEVVLVVGAVSPPVVLMGEISNSGMNLQCESSGWYPEPEVLWLDGKGNFLSAEPAQTVKGRDDLYSVSSRVSVERRNNINITCRVQQKQINQTREKDVQILDVYSASSNSAPRVGVVIAVSLLMLSAVFFVLWRMRRRRADKKPSDEESKKEEEVPFRETLKNKSEKKHVREKRKKEEVKEEGEENEEEKSSRERLKKEEEEEKKNMLEVLSLLEEQRQELENIKVALTTQLEEVEEDLKVNDKQYQEAGKNVFTKSGKLKSLEQIKCKLDKRMTVLKNSLESTEKARQRTSDMISKFNLQKLGVENETDHFKPDKVLEREETNERETVSMTEGQENEA